MIYSLLLVAAVFMLAVYSKRWKKLPKEKQVQQLKQAALWGFAGLVVVLVAMGRAHWLMGVIAGLVAVLGRLASVAKYIPIFSSLMGNVKQAQNQSNSNQANANVNGVMDAQQAADILGIELDSSKDDIVLAHKKLIQKVHPDRGGSDALAIQINQAKQVLLDQLG